MASGNKNEALQGSLTLLVLQSLRAGAKHGYAIASHIQRLSEETLRVEEGSLYPALHRMEQEGWIESEWGLTETNRKARFYRLTKRGQQQLNAERENWLRVRRGVELVLGEA